MMLQGQDLRPSNQGNASQVSQQEIRLFNIIVKILLGLLQTAQPVSLDIGGSGDFVHHYTLLGSKYIHTYIQQEVHKFRNE